jgi:serine/threonine protein kinase
LPFCGKWLELLREKKFSEKSDIWSFGVVSIELFTRNEPWPEKTALEVKNEPIQNKANRNKLETKIAKKKQNKKEIKQRKKQQLNHRNK